LEHLDHHGDRKHLPLLEAVSVLIDEGSNVNAKNFTESTPLHVSVCAKSLNSARLLITRHADIDIRDKLGQTPLHRAASNDLEITRLLLEARANVNAMREDGFRPLHMAAHAECLEIATLLIEKGADADALDLGGEAALHLAAVNGDINILKLLVHHGANTELLTPDGLNYIGVAYQFLRFEFIEQLSENGLLH
jgi:ankyrin repeat protein